LGGHRETVKILNLAGVPIISILFYQMAPAELGFYQYINISVKILWVM